jgi:hypothetical protein
MTHQRRHAAETFQVVVAGGIALAAVYFAVWPVVRPWDAEGALAFLPVDGRGRLTVFALVLWLVAAGCAVLTVSCRPEAALLATLAGAAGFSLRGGGMRALLWEWPAAPEGLFHRLALEALAMAGVLVGAAAVAAVVRGLVRGLLPRYAWTDPLAGLPVPASTRLKKDWFVGNPVLAVAATLVFRVYRSLQARGDRARPGGAAVLLGGVVMELAVALIMLVLTFRSTDRGQIQFALAASFLVAALVAHQTFPAGRSLVLCLVPLLVGVVVLALGAGAALSPDDGPAWHQALYVARGLPLRAALPADWLAFGCGGAAAGIWFSRRFREARHLEALTEQEQTPAQTRPAGARPPKR